MYSIQVKQAAAIIGQYYLQKHNRDYRKMEDEVRNLRISKIEVDENETTIHIHLSSPGLMIGKCGENISNLCEFYAKAVGHGVHIKIIEDKDCLLNYLIPYEDVEEYDMDYLLKMREDICFCGHALRHHDIGDGCKVPGCDCTYWLIG